VGAGPVVAPAVRLMTLPIGIRTARFAQPRRRTASVDRWARTEQWQEGEPGGGEQPAASDVADPVHAEVEPARGDRQCPQRQDRAQRQPDRSSQVRLGDQPDQRTGQQCAGRGVPGRETEPADRHQVQRRRRPLVPDDDRQQQAGQHAERQHDRRGHGRPPSPGAQPDDDRGHDGHRVRERAGSGVGHGRRGLGQPRTAVRDERIEHRRVHGMGKIGHFDRDQHRQCDHDRGEGEQCPPPIGDRGHVRCPTSRRLRPDDAGPPASTTSAIPSRLSAPIPASSCPSDHPRSASASERQTGGAQVSRGVGGTGDPRARDDSLVGRCEGDGMTDVEQARPRARVDRAADTTGGRQRMRSPSQGVRRW
jgi:hypothetical protein